MSGTIVFWVLFGGGLMMLEWAWGRRNSQRVYRLADTLTNLGCGLMERLVVLATLPALALLYTVVAEGGLQLDLRADSALDVALLLLLQDFSYYWLHRFHHRVGFLWAAHSVHHQSRELNFSVGLRTAAFQALTSWPFYVIVPLLGYPLWLFLAVLTFQNVFQLFAHTRLIPRLRLLDAAFNTASNHRVHHMRHNPTQGANFGGMLMLWDGLFGTYQPEPEHVEFGIEDHAEPKNPLSAVLRPWKQWWKSRVV